MRRTHSPKRPVEHWWNAMNAATQKVIEKVIDAVASTDGSITPDQRDAALAILNGHIPQQWPPLRQLLERNQTPVSSVNPSSPSLKAYLRRHEAAEYLGCSVRQIDALKHDGELPFHMLGRRLIVFSRTDLDAMMTRRKIG
jgi:excisionase family DNA binding protein